MLTYYIENRRQDIISSNQPHCVSHLGLKKVLRLFWSKKGLKTAIFQILKTIQGQDCFGQDQDLKKMVLRPRPLLRTTSLIRAHLSLTLLLMEKVFQSLLLKKLTWSRIEPAVTNMPFLHWNPLHCLNYQKWKYKPCMVNKVTWPVMVQSYFLSSKTAKNLNCFCSNKHFLC